MLVGELAMSWIDIIVEVDPNQGPESCVAQEKIEDEA